MRRSSKPRHQKSKYKDWVRQFEKDEKFRHLSPGIIISKVAGVTFNDPTSGENRQDIIKDIRKTLELMDSSEVREKVTATLEHAPNKYDGNATRVYINFPDRDYWVGFLPKELSVAIVSEILMYTIVDFAILGKGHTRHGIQLKMEKSDSMVAEAKIQAKPSLKWSSAAEARKALRKKA